MNGSQDEPSQTGVQGHPYGKRWLGVAVLLGVLLLFGFGVKPTIRLFVGKPTSVEMLSHPEQSESPPRDSVPRVQDPLRKLIGDLHQEHPTLIVSVEESEDGTRNAVLATAVENMKPRGKVHRVPLDKDRGIPLTELTIEQFAQFGMYGAVYEWKPTAFRDGQLLINSEREEESFYVKEMKHFGQPTTNVGARSSNQSPPQLLHRHAWSVDGSYLYVLYGQFQAHNITNNRLLKVNARTWVIEADVVLPLPIADMAVTAQGLVLSSHRQGSDAALLYDETQRSRSINSPTWFDLSHRGTRSAREQLGLLLVDADSLQLLRVWLFPAMRLAASNASDLVYVQYRGGLSCINVRTGEILSAYATGVFDLRAQLAGHSPPPNRPDQMRESIVQVSDLMLAPEGDSLLTFGRFRWTAHRYRLDGPEIAWHELYTGPSYPSSVDAAGGHLCIADQDYCEVRDLHALDRRWGRVAICRGAKVAIDLENQAIFICNPRFDTSLTLRMMQAGRDEEFRLAEQVDVGVQIPKSTIPAAQLRAVQELRSAMVDRGCRAMSVAPQGRGVIVFANDAVFWVEPKHDLKTGWAFEEPPPSSLAGLPERLKLKETLRNSLALVTIPDKNECGTAFCIDTRGYFVTHAAHVDHKEGGSITLLLRAGTFRQTGVEATVVKTDEQSDLAILKVDTASLLGVEALELGNDLELEETSIVTCYGFAQRPEFAISHKHLPSFESYPGAVTALRRRQSLEGIQVDSQLQPGNSGGPALDASGKVIGVIRGGLGQLGLNMLVPVSDLRRVWAQFDPTAELSVASSPPTSRSDLPQGSVDVEHLKSALGLVVLPSGKGFGTAFCIRKDGIFLTNRHVVSGVDLGGKVQLVIGSGGPGEREAVATVLRADQNADLAMLKLDNLEGLDELTALPLRQQSPGLDESLTALGFPFGDRVALRGQKYPTPTVSFGPVVNKDEKVLGEESTIELATQVNPGNSGGPLIDSRGQVAAVVFATEIGQRSTFGVPIESVHRMMDYPLFESPAMAATIQGRSEQLQFECHMIPLFQSQVPERVVLRLRSERGETWQHEMYREDHVYRVSSGLFPNPPPLTLEVAAEFDTGTLRGRIADRPITVGSESMHLRDVNYLHFKDDPHWTCKLDRWNCKNRCLTKCSSSQWARRVMGHCSPTGTL